MAIYRDLIEQNFNYVLMQTQKKEGRDTRRQEGKHAKMQTKW